MSAVGGQGLL